MTKHLTEAMTAVAQLSESEQEVMAAIILEELQVERHWSTTFAETPDLLAALADEALTEHHAGNTRPLDPAQL